MAKAQSKSDVRSRFTKTVEANAKTAKNVDQALKNKEQLKQHQVDKNGWTGDLFDLKNLGKPWETTENAEDLVNAIKDLSSPGVVGDLIASTLQGDWLATQERAFRDRHKTKIRADMHAASRRYGHGHDGGLFKKGVTNYLQNIVKQSKDIKK